MTDHDEADGDRHGDPTGDSFRSFDPATESVAEEFLGAPVTLNDVDPTEFAAPADVVDPDALDAFVWSFADGRPRDVDGRASFQYDDYLIRIATDGAITVSFRQS